MCRLETTATRAPTVAALLLSMVPGAALAQACLGVPISRGQFALDGGVTVHLNPAPGLGSENGTRVEFVDYGVGITGMRGAVTAGAAYTFSDISFIDETGHALSGHIGFELPIPGVSICPHIGAGHLRASQDTDDVINVTQSWVPIGFGIGSTIVRGLTLFAVPQYWFLRETENFERDVVAGCAHGPPPPSDSDIARPLESSCGLNYHGFNILAGIRVGTAHLFGGASLSVNLVDAFIDRQIGLDVSIGYTFGTPR